MRDTEFNRDVNREGERLFRICNACRYCEGFCAVYPAMERLTSFPPADLDYLANLCHNCGECYYACQYAPPHEFGVNMPQLLAELRLASYEKHAWPASMARAWRANGPAISILLAVCIAAALVFLPGSAPRPGDFYGVVSHRTMVTVFGAVSLFVAIASGVGLMRFWRTSGTPPQSATGAAAIRTLKDVLSLRYLGKDEAGSGLRRVFHHLTFCGFLLCFASTCVAAVYHYGRHLSAPYGYLSVPVILGAAGGAGLLAGPAGLFLLKRRRSEATQDPAQNGMDTAFLALLFLAGLTGLLLLWLRGTTLMPSLLAIHLGAVLALFLTLPYGKFIHGLFRAAALFRNAH